MAAAAEIVMVEGHWERPGVAERRDLFVGLLADKGFAVEINGPGWNRRHPGNANLRFDGFAAQDILGSVQPRLAASTGAACTSGIPDPSHVLRAMGLSETESDSSVRFSFGRFTSGLEVQEAANVVLTALGSLADTSATPALKAEELKQGK